MSKQETPKFISELVDELTPVKSNWSPEKRTFFFVGFNFLIILALMLVRGPFRKTLPQDFGQLLFGLEVVLFFVTIVFSSYFSFLSLVPGAITSKRIKFATITSLSLLIFLTYRMLTTHIVLNAEFQRAFCDLEVAILALIPLGQFYYFIKQGFYSLKLWSYFYAAIGSSFIPVLAMHFMCQPNYEHILLYHVGPALAVTAIFMISLKFIFRKS